MIDTHAPWALRGEVVVALVRGGRAAAAAAGALPGGLASLPGPVVVLAERFTESPVGAYVSLSFGRMARLGLRPGVCFASTVVNNHERRAAGRVNWGFPAEIGALSWDVDPSGGLTVRWHERDLEITVTKRGRVALPALVPLRSLQRRGDGPVVVPARVRGRVHRSTATVLVSVDDSMAPLAGDHAAAWIEGARLVVQPARHPLGMLSSLQAPLRAPEPGWSCEAALASRSRPPARVHSPVG